MGTWRITIEGSGAHHNKDNATDADKMARGFVKDLRAAGHQVKKAEMELAPLTSTDLAAE